METAWFFFAFPSIASFFCLLLRHHTPYTFVVGDVSHTGIIPQKPLASTGHQVWVKETIVQGFQFPETTTAMHMMAVSWKKFYGNFKSIIGMRHVPFFSSMSCVQVEIEVIQLEMEAKEGNSSEIHTRSAASLTGD